MNDGEPLPEATKLSHMMKNLLISVKAISCWKIHEMFSCGRAGW